jgi:hypothetical protein
MPLKRIAFILALAIATPAIANSYTVSRPVLVHYKSGLRIDIWFVVWVTVVFGLRPPLR